MTVLHCANRQLNLSTPVVMGILNATPDSFSDGGKFVGFDNAKQQVELMVEAGAEIIDIGGESTRPGAAAVETQDEIDRVLPLVDFCIANMDVVVSVDTSKPDVMRAAIQAGAHMINDVCALQQSDAVATVASSDVAVCLMHMKGTPRTMQKDPQYDDVVKDVSNFLGDRVRICNDAGIDDNRIVLDPGFGFGKTLDHNLKMLQELERFQLNGLPVLAGISRKSMIGSITGTEVDQRLAGSLAAALYALQNGAKILRVHDVAETVQLVRMFEALA